MRLRDILSPFNKQTFTDGIATPNAFTNDVEAIKFDMECEVRRLGRRPGAERHNAGTQWPVACFHRQIREGYSAYRLMLRLNNGTHHRLQADACCGNRLSVEDVPSPYFNHS
jgi:hypothetical protein